MVPRVIVLTLVAAGAVCCRTAPEPVAPDPAYVAEIEQWRSAREERLRSPDGWLSLAGLYWLEEGVNRFGSDPANDLVFPPAAPPSLGVLERSGAEVTVEVAPGALVLAGEEPVERMTLAGDKVFHVRGGAAVIAAAVVPSSPERPSFGNGRARIERTPCGSSE